MQAMFHTQDVYLTIFICLPTTGKDADMYDY